MDILFIDDEARRMRPTVEMLRADHYQVELIDDPLKSLSMLQENPHLCKIIILDIMMPVEGEFAGSENGNGLDTGVTLLEKIKAISGFELPVIVLTANHTVADRLRGKVQRFLHKPVPYAKLKAAVDELMNQKR